MELVVAEVVAILGKYVMDKGEGLLKDAGQAAADAARNLYDTVIARLKDDPATTKIAEGFETKPEGYQQPVQDALQAKVDADPALKAQLQALMESLHQATPAATWTTIVSGSGAAAINDSVAGGKGSTIANKGAVIVTGGTMSGSVGPPEERTPP